MNEISLKIKKLCKRLKIKLTKRTRSGKRVRKTLKQLKLEIKKKSFIQKANLISQKKGTVGAFRRWCKSKKLASPEGKVTMKCIKAGQKAKSLTIRRRANYAKNIHGYTH
jgi:hypothetical protein